MDADLLSIDDARTCAKRSRTAFKIYRRFKQEEVDRITRAVVEAGFAEAERLGRLAVEESGIGQVAGKTAKNRFATRGLWKTLASMRTCGIIREDHKRGIWEVADPFGVVAAIIPTTNPTSTALFKAIICLKSRNAMVTSPHPRSKDCIKETIAVCQAAAEEAGAPPDLLTCLTHVSLAGTRELLHSPDVDLILATGGSAMVRAAYSSGKPAFGVGPGNTPVYIDRSADPELTARALVDSLTFDNGTICSSEQALVCDRPLVGALKKALLARRVHWCTREETSLLEGVALKKGITNPDIVGLEAVRVARLAGFSVPPETSILVAPYETNQAGPDHPLSHEKLCPLVSFFEVDGFEQGCRICLALLAIGGRGHTLGLHCQDEAVIRAFAEEKPVNRLVVNSPTSQGAVGLTTNLFPSMTLGCGSFGGNITSDNIGPQHLLNIKRVAWATPAYLEQAAEAKEAPGGGREGADPAASPWERAAVGGEGEAVFDAVSSEMVGKSSRNIQNPAALGAERTARGPRRGPPVMGQKTGVLPGEHFSGQDLERIVQEALHRRRLQGDLD